MVKLKNKKLFVLIVFLIAISSTIAYLYSTDTFQNIFVAASYKVTVVETFESPTNWKPGDTTSKTVTFKNEGTVPIKVRVKLEEEWQDSNNQDLPFQHNGENVAIINFSNQDDYIYKDGYYYYDLALNPGETTSSIIESVTFNPNYSGTVTCIENDDSTHSCSSSESGYEGGTYKLTLMIEGVQEDYYVQAWGLPGIVERKYLYDVLKTETESGGLAKEYTGEHHDSFMEDPSEKIYRWYAKNDIEGTQIQNKNNVIFADHCWQMIRTTDTGGVKMIYNGEAVDNQCLNTRGNHVGYVDLTTQSLNSNYWYGTNYEYDSTTQTFTLSGNTEQVTWNATTGPTLVGKYTCKSDSETSTCSTLYLVESYYDISRAYAISIDSNSSFSQIGILPFNKKSDLPFYVGYMYTDNDYLSKRQSVGDKSKIVFFSSSLNISYWYSDSISYNASTNRYSLNNPYKVSSADEYPNLVGKYTFLNTSSSYSYGSVRYIIAVSGTTVYSVSLNMNNDINYYNEVYTYGDSYTDNGDGTYTINNVSEINTFNWYNNYQNVKNKYLCLNAVDNVCNDLWYVTYSNSSNFNYRSILDTYVFASDFIYDGEKYILNNNKVAFWESIPSIGTLHYTCWNATGECTSIKYVHASANDQYDYHGYYDYYIDLSNGENIENALDEMLYGNNINNVNSTVKFGIDSWYEKYLLPYSNYLEDTIFCNDRTTSNIYGWDSNSSVTNNGKGIVFNNSKSFVCSKESDKFSIYNNVAKLKYKIGLLPTSDIYNYMGIDTWSLTPSSYKGSYRNNGLFLGFNSFVESSSSNVTYGRAVRPAISLKPGIEYYTGDGSMEHPYIIDTDTE